MLLKNSCVVIVGKTALIEAKNFGLCLWATEKLSKSCEYIAFYQNKKIWSMHKVKTELVFNFEGDIPTLKELKDKHKLKSGVFYEYEIGDSLKRLKMSKVHEWNFQGSWKIIYFDRKENLLKEPIEHFEKGAFTQRPCYILADSLLNAKTTNDIKLLSSL